MSLQTSPSRNGRTYHTEWLTGMSKGSLRFRIKRGLYEIELEGDFEYVSQKFEEFMRRFNPETPTSSQTSPK
jgi:hypothetical protein